MADRTKQKTRTVGRKIKFFRTRRGMTQRSLGELLYKGESTVRMWELEKSEPDLQTLLRLSEILGVSIDFLANKDYVLSVPYSQWETDWIEDWKKADAVEKKCLEYIYGKPIFSQAPEDDVVVFLNKQIYMMPVYESASAGFGIDANDYITDYIPVPFDNYEEIKQTIYVKVQGNSMQPMICDGDLIQVKKASVVDSGKIAVVLISGESAVVKKVIYGKNWLELHSLNPNYPTRCFRGEEMNTLQIIGEVKKITRQIC